jgi:hypothetical protein
MSDLGCRMLDVGCLMWDVVRRKSEEGQKCAFYLYRMAKGERLVDSILEPELLYQ